MTGNEYNLKLYLLKVELEKLGVNQYLPRMIAKGFWQKTKDDKNYLHGRKKNVDFLDALHKLLEYNRKND